MRAERPVVLVVDDDPDTREMYGLALPQSGLTVVLAADVDAAIRCLAETQPDVVVTDLSLPRAEDGYELIRRVNGTPVIALTGWADPEHTAGARDAGCTAVLVKPCLPDTLAAAVRAVLASSS